MNVLSLFSGVGGLDLGLQRAGMTVVAQVELDPFCRKVLAKHWPGVPRHDDVRTCVDWWRSEPRPAVDLVCGGFPCQPVSMAGKRLGEADERWLWPAFLAVIRDLRPRCVLLENVAALLNRGVGTVLGDLAACGYDAEWDCVPAAAVGAPHRRDRWFCVAYPERERVRHQSVAQSGSGGAAITVHNGPPRIMADTEGERRELWPTTGERPGRPASSSVAMAHADGERCGQGSGQFSGLGTARRGASLGNANSPRRREGSRLGSPSWPTPVRTGWWSPEPKFRRMVDGISEGLDGGGLDADAAESGPAQDLSVVRQTAGSATAGERSAGGSGRLPAPPVLRSGVHGNVLPQRRSVHDLPQAVLEACMRDVWEHQPDRCAPHGREPDEQLVRELADALSSMPHEMALGERQAALAQAQSYVHDMRAACEATGALRDTSQPLAETWLALPRETQGWVWLAAHGGPWVAEWPDTPRIAHGIPNRVERLRALGNAVVPQVAEHIGRLILAADLAEVAA